MMMKLLYLFTVPLLSTIGVVFGQTAEQAIQTMDSYANDGKAFLVLRKQSIVLYEQGTFVNGTDSPDLFWLGPPTVVRDEGTVGANGKIVMAVALALQYNEEEGSAIRAGAGATTAKWQTAGFAATWMGNGYRYLFSDFHDETQKIFEDALAFQKTDTGSFHMPTLTWETSSTGTGGFVGSGFICWQNETDPLVMSMKDHLGVATGTELAADDFQDQYDSIYEKDHATSGGLSKGCCAFHCNFLLGVVAALLLIM
jgi:hypothetical protein